MQNLLQLYTTLNYTLYDEKSFLRTLKYITNHIITNFVRHFDNYI